jgi:hypothetical protein
VEDAVEHAVVKRLALVASGDVISSWLLAAPKRAADAPLQRPITPPGLQLRADALVQDAARFQRVAQHCQACGLGISAAAQARHAHALEAHPAAPAPRRTRPRP